MPLLYGEGSKAFIRLQHEILKQTDDESVFSWWDSHDIQTMDSRNAILADSPNWFDDCIGFCHFRMISRESDFRIKGRTLQLSGPLFKLAISKE